MARIAPSLLAADFSNLSNQIQQLESVEILHLDVMDGHFVPNISFGLPVVRSLRKRSDHYFDIHLMIERPEQYLDEFVDAGADRLTVHAEVDTDVQSAIESIHALNVGSGIALNPRTSVDAVDHLLTDVDSVLIMGVQPGFSGQEFIPETVEKIAAVNQKCETEIVVDGGVNVETAERCVEAGADTLVVGSAVFGSEDPQRNINRLRERFA